MHARADESLARPTIVRWWIVGLLMALSFASWFNRVSLSTAYTDRIKDQFGIDETDMGMAYSALLIVYMVWMTPGGWFTDRWGARLSLGLMALGLAVFVSLTGAVGSVVAGAGLLLASFILIRMAMGFFATPMYPAASQVVAHWIPFPRRGWANGLVQGAAPLGIATTYILFGSLIDWFNWQIAFLITGAATGAIGMTWLLYARNRPAQHSEVNQAEQELIHADDEDHPLLFDAAVERFAWDHAAVEKEAAIRAVESPGVQSQDPTRLEPAGELDKLPALSLPLQRPGSWLDLMRNRSLVCLTLAYAAVGYFEYLFFFWMQYYFRDVLELDEHVSRRYAAYPVLAMAVGMSLGGLLSDWLVRVVGRRWGRASVPMGGMIAAAALLYVGLRAAEPIWIVTWFSLALGAMGATEAPQWTTAIELGGRRGATAAGIFNTGGNFGGWIAPMATPWISEQFGWQWGIGVGSIVCLAGVCFWWWIDPGQRAR
jgi:MFS family permease